MLDSSFAGAGPDRLLEGIERCTEELANAAAEGDWQAVGQRDKALREALVGLGAGLESASAAECERASVRLLAVRARHAEAVDKLRRARDGVRAELSGVITGRRALALYAESSGR